jgi:adenylate kinase family enzyme
MERIMIIGCGGSGKSTLARQLGEKTGLPVVHLDKLFWRPGWVNLTREEFDVVHNAAIEEKKWILDGNFDRTMEPRIRHCDTVVYLDFSRMACLLGVMKRILTTYGKVRPDMGDGCPERFDLEFLQWVWNFNKNKREKNYRLLEQYGDKRIYILKNRKQVKEFLECL